jgi:hypothetical protein
MPLEIVAGVVSLDDLLVKFNKVVDVSSKNKF